MELTGFLNNIAVAVEEKIGPRLSEGEYRLGILDLKHLSEIEPLNQQFESLLFRCPKCRKATAFFSLGPIDNYLDNEKKSLISCRHCPHSLSIPKIADIRTQQPELYNFLRVEDWKFTKILSKTGIASHLSLSEHTFTFQYEDASGQKQIMVEVPHNKLKELKNLALRQPIRVKVKVFESSQLDPRYFLSKMQSSLDRFLTSCLRYELLSLSKSK